MASGDTAKSQAKKSQLDVREDILFGIGNPLLDISVKADKDFLDKYDLEANGCTFAEEKHLPLFEEMIKRYDVERTVGNACQNSFRAVQWILDQPWRTTFCGCVGNDKDAEFMRQRMAEACVRTPYITDEEHSTGVCAVILTGDARSLVAHLAAAEHFTKDHLTQPDIWHYVEKAEFYYIAGFHLHVAPDAMLAIAEHAHEHNKVFVTNLSAPFISEVHKEPQMRIMPHVDYLFGNKTEFKTFAREQNFETEDLEEIALQAAALEKENTTRQRVVVITQGSEDTIVAKDGEVTKYPVIDERKENIVDTNGAGDAFVGGFLAQLVQGKDVAECIRCANYAANYIIQRPGISFDGKAAYQ